ncbi:MFS transporter [Salirhabdus salicampi]|uniref:MFS transporter n=1 Tax=Salirhabdus salicampi TaxID=476102 RepID=UPI0020C3C8DB|nr:MFS transporter [Salirhabdus salicampi]MCP8615989.1 MFS transporter [Salirhabdus salicampi]
MSETPSNHDNEIYIENPKGLIVALCMVLMFSVMNGTMFNIAIPDIANAFDLMPSEVSWVMTGYIMIYAIGALTYGKLADFYPFKTLITFGLSVFFIGSLFGFFAQSYAMVLVARVIQAVGASMLPALVFLAPIRYFPKERGKILGIISSVMAFASGIGPIIGGLIAGSLSWEYLFLTSSLIIISLPFLRKNFPHEEKKEAKVDFIGAFFIGGTVSTLLIGITMGIGTAFIGTVLLLFLFLWRSKTAANPFVPPHLFKNRNYVITVITSFFSIFCLFGMMFTLPIMLRDVHALTTMGIGLVMFPGAMSAALIGQKGGRLVDEKGSRLVLIATLILLSVGLLIISVVAGLSVFIISACMILVMMNFPLVQASSADLLANILPKEETGVGMGVFNLMNFVAGALSGALIGKALDIHRPEQSINILAQSGASAAYSDIFLVLMVIIIGSMLLFRTVYTKNEATEP